MITDKFASLNLGPELENWTLKLQSLSEKQSELLNKYTLIVNRLSSCKTKSPDQLTDEERQLIKKFEDNSETLRATLREMDGIQQETFLHYLNAPVSSLFPDELVIQDLQKMKPKSLEFIRVETLSQIARARLAKLN